MGDVQRSAAAKIPTGRHGIKWETLKQERRKIKLANGEETNVPVTWRAFPNSSAVYVGYEVELDKDPKIQGWVLMPETAPNDGLDYTGWCHGLTFDDIVYSPGGNEIPKILQIAWNEIKCSDVKKGDIIVYYDSDGNVTHTATANGDGTYRSKGGATLEKKQETEASMDKPYRVPPGTKKCYAKKKRYY